MRQAKPGRFRLIQLVERDGGRFRLSPPADLSMTVANTQGEALVQEIQHFFQFLENTMAAGTS
ncbi:MAG: hypothetical protein AB1847_13525 [bacterium]